MARLTRLASTLLLALGWISVASAADELPVWELEGTLGNVYLMGSVHFLRKSDYPLPAGLTSALDAADQLVMEIDMDDLDPMMAQQLLGSMGMSPESRSLQEIMGPADYAQASDMASRIGIELGMFDAFEPWFVALTITQLRMMQMGFDPQWGIESQFTAEGRRQRKQISGLETLDAQLGFLDQLDTVTQVQFLMQSLEDAAEVEAEVQTIVGAWRTGDIRTLEALLVDGLRESPALYDAILTTRNRNWVPQITALADTPGTHLIVVGAMHLIGDNSVLAMLEKQGIKARQLSAD